MNTPSFSTPADYLIHLLDCAINNKQPAEKPKPFSFEKIFHFAQTHSVANIAFYSIEKLVNKPENPLYCQWQETVKQAFVRNTLQRYEFDKIIKALTSNKIKVIPLKGYWLQPMYPQIDYRTMSDLDILIKPADTPKAHSTIIANGYNHMEDSDFHIQYCKKPYFLLEVHTSLMIEESGKAFCDYYKSIWHKTKPTDPSPYCYNLNIDEYYIYMLVHLHRHYVLGGTGIRSIMDIYIFLKSQGNSINREYINSTLDTLGILNFALTAEQLSLVWFNSGESTKQTAEMALYILSSGTYGSYTNLIHNSIRAAAKTDTNNTFILKIKYILSRLFPKLNYMKRSYTVLEKTPVLLPVLWVYRLFKTIFTSKKRVINEYKTADKIIKQKRPD